MNNIIYITGVSGCGKSTIGKLLSDKAAIPFFDGDDFHPQSNIKKMSLGIPLNDEDRAGWLMILNGLALEHSQLNGAIIACSALKDSYRVILRNKIENYVNWIFLSGYKGVIQSRLESRKDHFIPSNLLQSQFDALEIPDYGLHLDITNSPDELVNSIIKELHL